MTKHGSVWIAVLVAAVGLGATGPRCDASRTESLRALDTGMQHYRSGRHTAALRSFREAVQVDESNDPAHYYLALLSFHQFHDENTAEKHFRRALDLNAGEPEYHYQYGALLQDAGKSEEALPYLQHAIDKRPDHFHAWYRLGQVRHAQGRMKDAVDAWTRSINFDPRFARPFIELGGLYLDFGHAREAAQVLRNCTENVAADPECHNELGRALQVQGDPEGAIAAFNRALSIKPDFAGALFNVGVAYRDTGNARKAVFYLKRYLAHADRKAEATRVTAAEQVIAGLDSTP